MSSWAISTLRRVAADIRDFEDGRFPHDVLDAFVLCLELVYREILVHEQLHGRPLNGTACTLVGRALNYLRSIQEEDHQPSPPPVTYTGSVGRPRFNIPSQQICFLVENGFTGPQMASIIGVSLSTVRRRMAEYGLTVSNEYAYLSDDVLDQLVMQIKHGHGHLLSHGYRVQQLRVREAMRRVYPEGSVTRQLRTLNRRHYRVPAPGSLWHIDGNHKLIR